MKITEIILSPEEAFSEDIFPEILYQKLNITNDGSYIVKPVRRSIDARGRNVVVRVQCEIFAREEYRPRSVQQDYNNVSNAKKVVIVGSGPAGLFAGLRLVELGFKPIIVERGKDVQTRRRDLAAINKDHRVNPDSN